MDPACADSPGADRGLAGRVAPPTACHTRRMNESAGYAVFFFPPALEALGEAIKPYLQDGPLGPHVPCREVDTSGAFIEMSLEGQTEQGQKVALDLMVPGSMVRMIVSAHSDNDFGFYDRNRPLPVMLEPGLKPVVPAPAAEAAASPETPSPDSTEPAKPA